ncbi:MAG TPA: two-component regulator propeller domain-containing protein [Balneolales bacterium]|nr:two-component regulator propeller domain-containing protein [Balneolales bacterium]
MENTGLGNSYIHEIALDSSGNQWYATNGGIAEYNGSVWKVYTKSDYGIQSNVISKIAFDSSGNLWAAESGFGILKFDGTTWTNYNSSNSKLPSNTIYDMVTQADTVWLGTDRGLVKFFGDSVSTFTFHSSYNNFTFTEVDKIAFVGSQMWIGSNGDVFYQSGGAWKDIASDGYCPLQLNVAVSAIRDAGNGVVWIAQGPLYEYDSNKSGSSEWQRIDLNTGNSQERLLGVDQLNYVNGILYASTGTNYGLATYDGTSWTFQEDPANQITSVTSNFCQVGDSVFFGGGIKNDYSYHSALFHYKTGSFITLTNQTTGLPTDNINGLTFDKQNRLWMATWSNGPRYAFLDMYDGQNYHEFDTTMVRKAGVQMQGAVGNNVAFDSKGNLWIGLSDGGVLKYDGQNFTVFDTTNSNLPSDRVRALAVDQNDNIWVGTQPDYYKHKYGGLAEYDGQSWAVYDTSNSGLTSNNVDAIAVDHNNNIWIGMKDRGVGTNDGGLVEYDGTNWTVQISKNNNHSFPDRQVFSLAVDKNNTIWAGSGWEYIYSFDGSTWSETQVPVLPNSSYSELDYINVLYVDSNNTLWANAYSKYMLVAYNGSQWVEYYNANSPLKWDLNNGLVEGPNGYIWVSSINGLFKVKDDPSIFTAIQKDVTGSQKPSRVKLDQNYPNPFNPSTNIVFNLPKAMKVRLLIYNVLGRVVAELSDARMSAGRHEFVWHATNMASGVYFYRIITPNGSITKKMLLLK